MQDIKDVRPSPIAGQWYPGKPEQLKKNLDRLLGAASEMNLPGEIVGVIAPHAGYRYSGGIAAHAFKPLSGLHYDTVIVISPMHHPYQGAVLTTAHEAYSTPLGVIPVDHAVLDQIAEQLPLTAVREDPEHSLEIELPFLQFVLASPFTLVPLMLRDQSLDTVRKLGIVLGQIVSEMCSVLLVASSDLSHFFTDSIARELDQVMLDHMAEFDPEAIIKAEQQGKAFACGRAAIATVMFAAKHIGAESVTITGYGTSADVTGDKARVVGYGAAVICR